MMRLTLTAAVVTFVVTLAAHAYADAASIKLVEGDFAKKLYDEQKDKRLTLIQKDLNFTLHTPGKSDESKPEVVHAKMGEIFFIRNDEPSTVHNVYDETDTSWVLKKQDPNSVAAVAFLKPGEHHFLCAIHPQMKVTVKVE